MSAIKALARWSKAPARDVDTASGPWVNIVRGLAARATTPLLPDDYLSLLNPLWSARELRGEIVAVRRETEDTATVFIRPGWGFAGDYQPGQYVGIGLRVNGRWHWRSYSLTSVPEQDGEQISITVKATPEGFLSTLDRTRGPTVGRLLLIAARYHGLLGRVEFGRQLLLTAPALLSRILPAISWQNPGDNICIYRASTTISISLR